MERENVWKSYDEAALKELTSLNEGYKAYITEGKTERKCVKETIRQAKAAGYRDLDEVIKNGETLTVGDCVYAQIMGKAIALFNIGKRPLTEGILSKILFMKIPIWRYWIHTIMVVLKNISG